MAIYLVKGDITTANVDAIVNAANERMLGGGGVDGAIHRAAGPELLEACRKIAAIDGIRCPTGEARITSGFQLPAKYIIHTVGPIYQQVDNASELLSACYNNALTLALENDCQSIALPAISCGVYGYPLKEAAKIAIQVCSDKKFSALAIYFYLFDDNVLQAWQSALKNINTK